MDPITVALPVGETVTMWLAAIHGAPLDILPTRQAARALCEDVARDEIDLDGDLAATWWTVDMVDEMYRHSSSTCGQTCRTGYTVAPIRLRAPITQMSGYCPPWCTAATPHTHTLADVSGIRVWTTGAEIHVTDDGDDGPTPLTPAQARSLGQAMLDDSLLGQALIQAANVAENGGAR